MKRLAVVSVLVALFAVMLHACGDPSHVYEGRIFDEQRKCLRSKSSIDVVEGERPGECEPRCFIQRDGDGSRAVYAATMCGPYPVTGFDVSGTDPICTEALAALARNDSCLADGGSTAPLPTDAAAD